MPARPCTKAVAALVAYLKGTGTGQTKLDTLTQLGEDCDCLDHVLTQAVPLLPEATMLKVDDFLVKQRPLDSVKGKATPAWWTDTKRYERLMAARQEEERVAREAAIDEAAEEPSNPLTTTPGEGAETSEVAADNAEEAIDKISRMRSAEKLEHIILNDSRKTVQEAAQKRLDELNAE